MERWLLLRGLSEALCYVELTEWNDAQDTVLSVRTWQQQTTVVDHALLSCGMTSISYYITGTYQGGRGWKCLGGLSTPYFTYFELPRSTRRHYCRLVFSFAGTPFLSCSTQGLLTYAGTLERKSWLRTCYMIARASSSFNRQQPVYANPPELLSTCVTMRANEGNNISNREQGKEVEE